MKIQIEKTVKETSEVEIILPYYSKDSSAYYAVLSENDVIRVYPGETFSGVTIGSLNIKEAVSGERIEKEDFELALSIVLKKIINGN